MFVGRKEFGERHRKFVAISIILFVITIILVVILIVALFASIYSINYHDLENIDLSWFKNIFLFAPLAAILGGIINVLLVHELEDRKGKIILYIAFVVTIILSFYVLYEGMLITEEWTNNTESLLKGNIDYSTSNQLEDLVEKLQQDLSSVGIFSSIGNILFLIAYIIPYKRIKSGELVPALPSHLKRCQNCGRIVQKDYKICPYCGKEIEAHYQIGYED